MASPLSLSRRRQPAAALSRPALKARDALVLEHLPLAVAARLREAVAIASAMARRLFPLVEREDLIQVAREALVRSAPRCRAGEPAGPYLRRCITGVLQHHLRDRVRLVRVPCRLHEQGQGPLRHLSLDASVDGERCLLNQLPAAQATALRLTIFEGLSLRAAAKRLEISALSVQRAQKKVIAALRQQLEGGG
jgi:RNA polymerase sigma-B factor